MAAVNWQFQLNTILILPSLHPNYLIWMCDFILLLFYHVYIILFACNVNTYKEIVYVWTPQSKLFSNPVSFSFSTIDGTRYWSILSVPIFHFFIVLDTKNRCSIKFEKYRTSFIIHCDNKLECRFCFHVEMLSLSESSKIFVVFDYVNYSWLNKTHMRYSTWIQNACCIMMYIFHLP